MKIVKTDEYKDELKEILRFIAKNHPQNARDFKSMLDAEVKKLPHFPYKFRRSFYYDNDKIRDLIFKGYTVPYLIQYDRIVILGILKWRDS